MSDLQSTAKSNVLITRVQRTSTAMPMTAFTYAIAELLQELKMHLDQLVQGFAIRTVPYKVFQTPNFGISQGPVMAVTGDSDNRDDSHNHGSSDNHGVSNNRGESDDDNDDGRHDHQ